MTGARCIAREHHASQASGRRALSRGYAPGRGQPGRAAVRRRPCGRESCPACPSLAIMARDPAALGHIRDQVGRALRGFLAQQRAVLLRAGAELLPGLEALEELLAAGKRLRPAFCYWGWRGAGGQTARRSWPRRPRWSCCTPARWCMTTSWTAATPGGASPHCTAGSRPATRGAAVARVAGVVRDGRRHPHG